MSVSKDNTRAGYFTAILLFCALSPVTTLQAAHNYVSAGDDGAHLLRIENWRSERHASLSAADGYLSQVGLEWLNNGENRIGSAADNDIQLTGGPAVWGSVFLESDQLRFVSAADGQVSVDGEWVNEARLIADTEGEATIVRAGTFSFHVIFRESFALRVIDSQAVARVNFAGVENYPINDDWLINGRFTPAPAGTTIEIVNVLGQVNDSNVMGTFEFIKDGESHSLIGLADEESSDVWFIFADRTSGHGTYGAGRFLHSDAMPEGDRLTVDFNKAYNPPCAFNPFSTCPLPPQRNRLDLEVTAGEKDFHPDAGS